MSHQRKGSERKYLSLLQERERRNQEIRDAIDNEEVRLERTEPTIK